MEGDDIGFLADADEVLTRDFFRALQTCDDIVQFDYATHQCRHEHVKILSMTRNFEGSPECITKDREGWHPEVMIGHCIAGIGDSTRHADAPRDEIRNSVRAAGFGKFCTDWDGERNITDGHYPLWNAADLRRTCGGAQIGVLELPLSSATTPGSPITTTQPQQHIYEKYTAFHFHNFFAHLNHIRFKYRTYGHADPNATIKPLYQLLDDLHLMYKCVLDQSDAFFPHDATRPVPFHRIVGGFDQAQAFLPIYFYDANYRQRRHDHVRDLVLADQERYPSHV